MVRASLMRERLIGDALRTVRRAGGADRHMRLMGDGYMVARRRNEIGSAWRSGRIRGDVVTMVMREAAVLLAAGVIVVG